MSAGKSEAVAYRQRVLGCCNMPWLYRDGALNELKLHPELETQTLVPESLLLDARAYAERCTDANTQAEKDNDELRAKLRRAEALAGEYERDALRYRWLRTFPNNTRQEIYTACNLLRREEYLDIAIDAGIGSAQESKG